MLKSVFIQFKNIFSPKFNSDNCCFIVLKYSWAKVNKLVVKIDYYKVLQRS